MHAKSSIYMLNIMGEIIPPCLTPLPTCKWCFFTYSFQPGTILYGLIEAAEEGIP